MLQYFQLQHRPKKKKNNKQTEFWRDSLVSGWFAFVCVHLCEIWPCTQKRRQSRWNHTAASAARLLCFCPSLAEMWKKEKKRGGRLRKSISWSLVINLNVQIIKLDFDLNGVTENPILKIQNFIWYLVKSSIWVLYCRSSNLGTLWFQFSVMSDDTLILLSLSVLQLYFIQLK